jgi:hypothetical protein
VGSVHEWDTKPRRPTLYRANPICSKLLFASAPGWTGGFGNGSPPIGEVENVREYRGVWNAATLNASPWAGGNRIGGKALDNGDGSFTSAPEFLIGAADTRYDITFGASWAVLVRPDALSSDGTLPFFKRRNQPYDATTPGWMFSCNATNLWRFAFCDGVTERAIHSVTAQNVFRGDLLIATATPTALNLYVNGQLESSTSFAATAIGNPSGTPIKFLGLGTVSAGQPNYAGLVSAGYVWSRVITQSEINDLASDAFTPYRWPELDDIGTGGFQSFHLSY